MDLIESRDDWQPSPEEERDYWYGEGHVTFFVEANREDVFEIEVYDYSGCVGSIDEVLGIETAIRFGYLGNGHRWLKEGYFYTIHGVTAHYIRGDGWNTDDDCDYYHEGITRQFVLWPWLKQTIKNLWWFNIGWRLK